MATERSEGIIRENEDIYYNSVPSNNSFTMRKNTLNKKKNEDHQNISKRTSANQLRDISAVKLRRKSQASQQKI